MKNELKSLFKGVLITFNILILSLLLLWGLDQLNEYLKNRSREPEELIEIVVNEEDYTLEQREDAIYKMEKHLDHPKILKTLVDLVNDQEIQATAIGFLRKSNKTAYKYITCGAYNNIQNNTEIRYLMVILELECPGYDFKDLADKKKDFRNWLFYFAEHYPEEFQKLPEHIKKMRYQESEEKSEL